MTRLALISLLAAACSSSQASQPAQPNLVCERLAIVESAAKCTPELTASGETHVHRARVTQDKSVAVCVLNDLSVSVVCGPMFVAPEPQRGPTVENAEKVKAK